MIWIQALLALFYLALGFASVVWVAYQENLYPGDETDMIKSGAILLAWPIWWAVVFIAWFINLPMRMGRSFR